MRSLGVQGVCLEVSLTLPSSLIRICSIFSPRREWTNHSGSALDYKDMAPFQTPPLRVSRIVSACARCRSAKTRCDGKLPACTHCERAGKAAECISSNDEFARGRERSYVASLESRIERLEAEKRNLSLRNQHLPPASAPPSSNDTQIHNLHKQKEASDVDELVSDFGYLYVYAARCERGRTNFLASTNRLEDP